MIPNVSTGNRSSGVSICRVGVRRVMIASLTMIQPMMFFERGFAVQAFPFLGVGCLLSD